MDLLTLHKFAPTAHWVNDGTTPNRAQRHRRSSNPLATKPSPEARKIRSRAANKRSKASRLRNRT